MFRIAVLAAAVAVLPIPAEAHATLAGIGGFWSGVAHLLTSFDLIAYLLGLAICTGLQRGLPDGSQGGLQGQRDDAITIASVSVSAFAGVFIQDALAAPLDVEAPAAVLMLAIGIAGAVRLRLGQVALVGAAVAGGTVVGLAGADSAAGGSAALVGLGGGIAAASVLSYGLIATHGCRAEWARIGLRALASWIATIGLILLAFYVRRHLDHA